MGDSAQKFAGNIIFRRLRLSVGTDFCGNQLNQLGLHITGYKINFGISPPKNVMKNIF